VDRRDQHGGKKFDVHLDPSTDIRSIVRTRRTCRAMTGITIMNATTPRPLALVTGASAGIGAELARELARRGHDLVLTARRLPPMQALAAKLREAGAEATVIAADLSHLGAAAALSEDLAGRGLAVDVLVNNAGFGMAGRFARCDPGRLGEMLQVNVVALTELTRLLLPGMVARGRGRILLVASVAGFQPGPHMAAYFASKAYVLSLGEALAYELRGTGVTVTTLCPGATATEFFDVAGAEKSIMARHLRRMMPAAEVARLACRALEAGRRVVITGAMNRITALAGRYAPRPIVLPVTERLMKED
jgi:short-subunit dehydrogenase